MHHTPSLPTDPFPEVLTRLPDGLDLDALARETKAIQRRRELASGASLLRLALAHGPGGLSLRHTAAWAALLGIAHLSPPGLKYRLDQAVGFLAALVNRLLAAQAPGAALRWPGRLLRLSDATCVTQPGSRGIDWRLHAVFDLARGGFAHLELTDAHGPETLERGAPLPGEIRVADRAYARAPVLQRFRAASDAQADFLVRLGWNAMRLTTPAGQPFDLIAHLQALAPDQEPHEVEVCAAVGRDPAALALRLIVQRKPPEAAEAARAALRRAAVNRGKRLDPRSLIAAEFMILATSLPARDYEAGAVLAVYRLRWQIELAFKRLKSLLHIDRLPARTEPGARSWLYAHLVLALVCDEVSQEVLAASP
jgi:hypothetical protein